jgi:iron complex transport system ATP-binding protein
MKLKFPGVTMSITAEALVLCSEQVLNTLSSAVIGGGFSRTHCIINRHVDKNYDDPNPVGDYLAFAREHGIGEPFVGLMTAVDMDRARAVIMQDGGITVAVVVTAGLSNPASPGLSSPVLPRPGTINLILLIDANLTSAAMVNVVITATEAKAHLLLENEVHTPERHLATGTSTDAVVVACTGRGNPLAYGGPVTRVGWLIGRSVRQGLDEAFG